jgi:hypothetical protein
MTLTGKAMLAGIAGWPVSHSRSPLLHGTWIARHGLDAAYVPLPIHPDHFASAIHGLRDAGFRGLNVTIPHKEAAFAVCQTVTPRALRAGAVNTLVFREDRIEGDCTDGFGFLASLGNFRPGFRKEGGNTDGPVHAEIFCTACPNGNTDIESFSFSRNFEIVDIQNSGTNFCNCRVVDHVVHKTDTNSTVPLVAPHACKNITFLLFHVLDGRQCLEKRADVSGNMPHFYVGNCTHNNIRFDGINPAYFHSIFNSCHCIIIHDDNGSHDSSRCSFRIRRRLGPSIEKRGNSQIFVRNERTY